jgi:hypothetical protein
MDWLWKETDYREEFSHMYAKARESQAEVLADQIIEIADDSTGDYIFVESQDKDGQGAKKVVNKEYVKRSALRVDARKWAAAKLLPKKYGDKTQMEHSGPNGGAIPTEFIIKFVKPDEHD